MQPTPGSVVLIGRSTSNPTPAFARVEKLSRNGMFYLTDQFGGDRVCFPDELQPAKGASLPMIPPQPKQNVVRERRE